MPSPPSGSQFLANVGDTSAWYLTTDTGGVYDTKIYNANGTLLVDIPNGDAAGALGYAQITPQLFYVDLAGSAGQTVIYATDDTPAGTGVVMTVSGGTASPFTDIGSLEVFEVTTSAPASETIGGTLYNYTVYTSTLYTTNDTPRSPQAIAQVSYGTPFDETDGGFSNLNYGYSGAPSFFTATASSVATGIQGGVPYYYTELDTNLYETDGTSGGTHVVLQNITSATEITVIGNYLTPADSRTLFNVVVDGETKVYSVNASGGDPQLVLTLDGVYTSNVEIDFRGNQFIGETDGTTLDFYVTDGTAAGTQLLLSTPNTSYGFFGSSLGVDFFQFNTPTGQQLYETGLTAATTHLVATIPLDESFVISPLLDIMLPPPEGTNIVVSELASSGTVVKQFWINPYNEAIAPVGDEYDWIGPLSGDWNTASNWEDTTLGTDPANAPPDSSDDVGFSNDGTQFQIIGGTGASYQLGFEGEHTVVGTFTTGVLWVNGYVGELQIGPGGSISAGDGLLDVSVTIDGGTLSVSNSLTIDDPHINDTGIDTVVTVVGGKLDVGGTLTVESFLRALDGGQIQAAALVTDGDLLGVDATSSIEIGDAGGAARGALTIDAGATLSTNAYTLLSGGDIIDNGTITVTGPGNAYVYDQPPLVLLSDSYHLSGNGQVILQDKAEVVVGGPVLAGSLAFQLGNGSSLTLDAVGAGNTIALNGNDVVALDGQETYNPLTHGDVLTYDMEAVISGFDASDTLTIDTVITNATYTAGSTAGTGTLALTDGTTLVATINLDGNYTGDTFLVTSAPSSGSDIALSSGALTVVAPIAETVGLRQTNPIGGLRLAEAGNTTGRFSVTLSDTYGLLTANGAGVGLTGSGTTSLTISGPLAQVNAALATVKDTDAVGAFDTLTLAASDAHGNTTTKAVSMTVSLAPVVQATVSAIVALHQTVAIGGVIVAESGSTAGETFTVTAQDQRGLLAATGPGVSGSGTTGGLIITGTLAQVNAALATLTDTAGDSAPDKIQVFATDSYGNHASAANIAVGVNGKPVIAVPATAAVGVDQAAAIAGVALSETGTTTGERFTVTLSDTAGLLTASGAGVTIGGSGTTSLTISGTLAQVNAALATLADTAPSTVSDSIALAASDSYGGTATAASIPVTVSGVAAPAAMASIRATALHLGGAADPSWGSGEGGVTVSLLNGVGTVIAAAVTNSAGQATFGNLAAGTYELRYTAPTGQGFMPGGPDSAGGETAPFAVATGQSLIGPSGDLMATLVLNGTGLNATPAAGGYLVTGNAANSTLTLGNYGEYITLTGGGDTVTTGNGNETIALSGVGNTVTVGGGNSVINAGTGGATVHATGGDVTITAAGAGNLLDGGSGLSFLNADGSAYSVFMPGGAGTPTANMTTISGFNPAAGDILDLKHTLAGAFTKSGLPDWANDITAVSAGPNTVLLADPTGGAGSPTAFATLLNIHVSVAQLQALNAFSMS